MRRNWQSEDGVALVTALLAVVILGGMAVVFVNRAITEQRASGASQRHETVLHTAEAAADVQIAALNADDDHVTTDESGAVVTLSDADRADEDAWIRGLLSRMEDSDAWVTGDAGESYAVRPQDATGAPLDVIYAAGAVPGFGEPNATIRTLKLQVSQDRFTPNFALLTDGHLDFGGNASIVSPGCDTDPDKCVADVHVNAGAAVSGSASRIQGQLRVAGGSCPSINASSGCIDDGVQPQPIPPFSARSFYGRDADNLNDDPGGESVEWFDLCRDGTVRELAASGIPCTGDLRWPDPADPNPPSNFRGWDWRPSQNTWRGQSLNAGAFYVHHADADVTGSKGSQQRAVTIMVEGDPGNPTKSGSLKIGGNPKMQAATTDVLFITDRDLDMAGTASGGTGEACNAPGATYSGFIGVIEQLKVGGNVSLRGAAVVRDAEQLHGMVTRNTDGVTGNMCLEFDPNLDVSLTGIWVVTFWNEM